EILETPKHTTNIGTVRRIGHYSDDLTLALEHLFTEAISKCRAVGILGMQDDETCEFEHIDSVFCQKAPLQSIRQAVAHGIGTQRGKIAVPCIGRDQGHTELSCQRREFYRHTAQQRTNNANDLLLIDQGP